MSKLTDLVNKATVALHGKPPWGKTLVADFGPDGVLCVYPQNQVAAIPNANVSADCIITFPKGIASLENLERPEGDPQRETAAGEWWNSELKWVGDKAVAEQFVAIITGKKS